MPGGIAPPPLLPRGPSCFSCLMEAAVSRETFTTPAGVRVELTPGTAVHAHACAHWLPAAPEVDPAVEAVDCEGCPDCAAEDPAVEVVVECDCEGDCGGCE